MINNTITTYDKYDNVIIITDDGKEADNTFLFYRVMIKLGKDAKLFYTQKKISAKSNAVSLIPIKLVKKGSIICMDSFPADCLLYNIFNCHYSPLNTLFVFGINEHNHFGYGNYVSSTTSLLLLAKFYGYKAFAISSEIQLNESFIKDFYYFATNLIEPWKTYVAFNINKLKVRFKTAKVSRAKFDYYEELDTNRGPFCLLTYNLNPNYFQEGTDGYFQVHKKNYIVELF